MNALRRFAVIVAIAVVVLVVASAIFIYTGTYDVSATSGHTKIFSTVLDKIMVESVRARAHDIASPVNMDFRNPEVLEHATGHFEAMCRTCHGAPGKKPDPWVLYPPAPDLATAIRDRHWNDAEVFWIIKNGIKDTAMSAFGGSHRDEDIWGLVALVRQFNTMTPEQYQAMAERARAETGEASQHNSAGATEKSSAPPSETPGHKD